MTLHLKGRVGFRSSKGGGGPPSESEVLLLNPQRRGQLLAVTGRSSLEPGSLNLDVDRPAFDQLLQETPVFKEPGASVKYPPRCEQIPLRRKAYLYYRAVASAKGRWCGVLLRRTEVRGPIRVELFSAESLKKRFELNAGDIVEVTVG